MELDEKQAFEDLIQMEILGFSSTNAYLEFRELTETVIKETLSEVRERWLEVVDDKESFQQRLDNLEKLYLEKAEPALERIKTEMRDAFKIPENPVQSTNDTKVSEELNQLSKDVEKLEDELILDFKTLKALKLKKIEIDKILQFIKEINLEEKLRSPLKTDEVEELKKICNAMNKTAAELSIFPNL